MKPLTPVEHRAVRADAFLMFAREVSGWRATEEPTAQPVVPDDEPALVESPPHRHSAAWFRDMHRRNRLIQRGKR